MLGPDARRSYMFIVRDEKYAETYYKIDGNIHTKYVRCYCSEGEVDMRILLHVYSAYIDPITRSRKPISLKVANIEKGCRRHAVVHNTCAAVRYAVGSADLLRGTGSLACRDRAAELVGGAAVAP